MTFTPTHAAWRRKLVGASDVPALFVPDWFRTAGDLYLEKIGAIEDMPDAEDEGDSPLVIGSVLESSILTWAKKRLGITKGRQNVRRRHKTVHLGATLDYQITETAESGTIPYGMPLEVKTTGIMGRSRFAGEWGPDGTDEVPTPVMLQVQAQMACTGAERAYVAALIAYRGLMLYEIERCNQLIEVIEEHVEDFWVNHVLARRPPPNATMETLSKVSRVSGETAVVHREFVDEYQRLTQQIRELEARKKEIKEWLIRDLEVDGEYVDHGMTEDEWWEIDYPLVERPARMVAGTSYRTLRIKKGPAQKMMEGLEDGDRTDSA